MLIELRAKNCFSFLDKIIFSAKADMRNKKFASAVSGVSTLSCMIFCCILRIRLGIARA